MKRILLLVVLLSTFKLSTAEIQFDAASVIGLGNLLPQSLVHLTNDGVSQSNCQLQVRVLFNGSLVSSGTIDNVTIPNGSTALSLSGILQTYSTNSTRGRFMRDFNWITPGEYQICFDIITYGNSVADYCEVFEEENSILLEHISPDPIVNLNGMQSSVLDYCWSGNLPSDNSVQYTLSIYPVFSGQTSQDAVLNNTSLYSQSTSGVCLVIPSSILLNSGYLHFAWNVKVKILDTEASESSSSTNTILLAESYPSELKLSNETTLEYCYITPEVAQNGGVVYPVFNCELLLDMDEFNQILPDSISLEFRDSSNNYIGTQDFQIVNNKQFLKIQIEENICNQTDQQLRVTLRVDAVTRYFAIIFKP